MKWEDRVLEYVRGGEARDYKDWSVQEGNIRIVTSRNSSALTIPWASSKETGMR